MLKKRREEEKKPRQNALRDSQTQLISPTSVFEQILSKKHRFYKTGFSYTKPLLKRAVFKYYHNSAKKRKEKMCYYCKNVQQKLC